MMTKLLVFLCLIPLVVGALLFILNPNTAYAIDPVWKVLSDTQTEGSFGASIASRWKEVLNIIDALIIVLLIFVSFTQILHINVNTYGVKKVLPALIFAVIAANFSFLVCRLLIDFANVAIRLLVDPNEAINSATKFHEAFKAPAFKNPFAEGGSLWDTITTTIFLIVAGIMMMILGYLLYIRNWLLYFFVVLSPLAFMATVLPQTKSLFNQWWSNFVKWTFMPVVSIFWIWLASLWIGEIDRTAPTLTTIFAIVAMYLAITTPFKMGGAVMSQWGGLGKKFWGATGGKGVDAARKAWIDNNIDAVKDRMKRWYLRQANRGAPTEDNPNVSLKDRIMGQTIGRYVRRSYRTRYTREWIKKGVDTAEDSAYREALGGKRIPVRDAKGNLQYEDEYRWVAEIGPDGKPVLDDNGKQKMVRQKVGRRLVTQARFMSREKQIALGAMMDDVNSDSGEKDWIMLDLDNTFHETDAGRRAGARSFAYRERMKHAKSIQETNAAETGGIFAAGGATNEFLKNPNYGQEWSRMYQEGEYAAKLLQIVKMSADKLQKDAQDEDEVNAIGLNQIKILFNNLTLALQRNTKQLLGLGVDMEHLDDNQQKALHDAAHQTLTARISNYDEIEDEEERRKAAFEAGLGKEYYTDQHRRIMQERQETNELWDEHISQTLPKIIDKSTGQVMAKYAWLAKMLGQGISRDASGNYFANIEDVDDLATTLGIAPEMIRMVEDRLTKRESILAKDELASTAGKRDGLESRHEILGGTYTIQQLKDYMRGGKHLMAMDSHMRRKIRSEENNALTKAGPAGSETFMRDQEMMAEWFYQWARENVERDADGLATDEGVQEYIALNTRAHNALLHGLQEGSLTDAAEIRKRLLADGTRGFKSEADVFTYLETPEGKKEFSDLVKAEFASKYAIDVTQLDQLFDYSEVDIDKAKGVARVKIKDRTDALTSQNLDALSALEQNIYTSVARTHRNDRTRAMYVQALSARVKEDAPTNREMGKDDEHSQTHVLANAGQTRPEQKSVNAARQQRRV